MTSKVNKFVFVYMVKDKTTNKPIYCGYTSLSCISDRVQQCIDQKLPEFKNYTLDQLTIDVITAAPIEEANEFRKRYRGQLGL